MDRSAIKQRIKNGGATPDVPQDLFIELLTECIAEQTGQTPRLVDLNEAASDRPLPGTDHHARFRSLLEGSAAGLPKSDLKDPDRASAPAGDPFLPAGVDLAGAMRRAAEGYKQAGITLNTPVVRAKPVTLAESREELAKRVTDPVERGYLLLSGRA
jgi:hypothetical protein